MATVSTSVGISSSKPGINVYVSGLEHPSKDYPNFRIVISQGGVHLVTRNMSYWSTGTSATFYIEGSGFEDNGVDVLVQVYATYNGTEYFVGQDTF